MSVQANDGRTWDDIPSSFSGASDVVSYDAHESMPRGEPDSQAFLDAVHRLVPDPRHGIVVAAELAAGFAVQAALAGLAGALLLFQPAPDHIPPEAMVDASVEELLQAAAPYAGIVDALRDSMGSERNNATSGRSAARDRAAHERVVTGDG